MRRRAPPASCRPRDTPWAGTRSRDSPLPRAARTGRETRARRAPSFAWRPRRGFACSFCGTPTASERAVETRLDVERARRVEEPFDGLTGATGTRQRRVAGGDGARATERCTAPDLAALDDGDVGSPASQEVCARDADDAAADHDDAGVAHGADPGRRTIGPRRSLRSHLLHLSHLWITGSSESAIHPNRSISPLGGGASRRTDPTRRDYGR